MDSRVRGNDEKAGLGALDPRPRARFAPPPISPISPILPIRYFPPP